MSQDDNFTRFKPHPKDLPYVAYFLLFAFLLIYNVLASSTPSYGAVYINLAIIVLIFFVSAFALRGSLTSEVVFGKLKSDRDFWKSYGIGVAISLVITSAIYLGFSLFSFFQVDVGNVFSVNAGLLGLGVLGVFFVGQFLAGNLEEDVGAVVVPTFGLLLKNPAQLSVVLILGGIIFAFVNISSAQAYIGILLIAFGVLLIFSKKLKQNFAMNTTYRVLIAILLYAFIAASYHVRAYGSFNVIAPFLFATEAWLVNWKLQNAVQSKGQHITNNGIVLANTLQVSILYPLFMVIISGFILWVIFKYGDLRFNRGVRIVSTPAPA